MSFDALALLMGDLDDCPEVQASRRQQEAEWAEFEREQAELAAERARRIDCPRCYGRGTIPHFRHVSGGTCFGCNGKGKVTL